MSLPTTKPKSKEIYTWIAYETKQEALSDFAEFGVWTSPYFYTSCQEAKESLRHWLGECIEEEYFRLGEDTLISKKELREMNFEDTLSFAESEIQTTGQVRSRKPIKGKFGEVESRSDEASIIWSVEDFEHQASHLDENFDQSKFESTLHLMVGEHDANIGITWDTITEYLRAYCK